MMKTSTERKRLAVLSFRTASVAGCLLAALAVPLAAASPALAEADNHSQEQNLGRASSNAIEDPPYAYAPPPVYAPPVYAPPTYAPPTYAPQQGPTAYAPELTDDQITRHLRRQGYRRVSDIGYANTGFGRGHYTARARDQSNRPVWVMLSAETGQVLDVRPLR